MDRFIVKEPRAGAGFPQGNQMMAFPANARSGGMMPENLYYNGGYPPNFQNVQPVGNVQNMNDYSAQAQSMRNSSHLGQNSPHLGQNSPHLGQNSPHLGQNPPHLEQNPLHLGQNPPHLGQNPPHFGQNPPHLGPNPPHLGQNSPHLGQNPPHLGPNPPHLGQNPPHLGQTLTFPNSPAMMPQGHVMSGIDPGYLAHYGDKNPQYILAGQQTQIQKSHPLNSFGSNYENRSFGGVDRNKNLPHAIQQPQVMCLGGLEPTKVEEMPKQQPYTVQETKTSQQQPVQPKFPSSKNSAQLDLIRSDCQNQMLMMTRADKLKALNKSGPRAFSGPVEKVLKWHKTLQEVGLLIIYEIVGKCVSIRAGANCAKNLVVRDDNGPAMQVVYYEIDFLLPDLKPPCTVRVIGRMMAGTCRLQAFNVRLATGDDVATLPRRAAVATHHVAKLCKEYGHA